MKNFLLSLSVITALAGAFGYFVSGKFPQVDFSLITYLCIYFFVITALSHYTIIRAAPTEANTEARTTNNKFFTRYMLITVSKFFLSVLILVGYSLLNPDAAVSFIILFAVCYFLYTTFEVFSLMRYFRGKSN